MAGGKRLRAHLDDDCGPMDFYNGFYLRPKADGKVCADRDVLRMRSGASCGIAKFAIWAPQAESPQGAPSQTLPHPGRRAGSRFFYRLKRMPDQSGMTKWATVGPTISPVLHAPIMPIVCPLFDTANPTRTASSGRKAFRR